MHLNDTMDHLHVDTRNEDPADIGKEVCRLLCVDERVLKQSHSVYRISFAQIASILEDRAEQEILMLYDYDHAHLRIAPYVQSYLTQLLLPSKESTP